MAKIREQADDLEKMIASADENISTNVAPCDIPGISTEPTFDLDFKLLKKQCDNQAKKMLKKATGFMLSKEMMSQNPYLRDKMQVDIISLSGMLYQLKVNETMQETLMEEVRSGSAQARMFEVFSQLSKTIGELNKQLLQTVEAIKSTYKDAKFDIREREDDLKAIGPGQNGITRNAKGLIALGTKELIKETKKLKASMEAKIDDAQIVAE